MILLAIDTTSRDAASAALMRDDRLIALSAPRTDRQHSVEIFHLISGVLDEAGLSLREVDVLGAANGPGAFTALRVSLSVVKGLAEVHRKPVVPVSVLEAVCESARAQGLLVPLVDAYRGQVFGGLYRHEAEGLRRCGPERVLTLGEFVSSVEAEGAITRECTVVSPQLQRWEAELQDTILARCRREVVSPVLADAVACLATRKFAVGEFVDALRLEANYVRRSDAELLWKGP
jgi:tRNA threonylcarbamoyladenosine biosynthesis protein TsaB